MSRLQDFALLESSHGIFMPPEMQGWLDPSIAMDAQPASVTISNAGIPAFLQNYMDPKVIQVLVTPNKAAKILGETKKGDWVTRTITFPMVESSGEVSSYGDHNNNGSVGANVQFPERQSYHYQTITQWGQKQLAEAGLAKIDWAARLEIASVMVLDKFQNNSYFFGISGLKCLGLLNDPALSAPITPALKASGFRVWSTATPNEIYADIQAIFQQLVIQSNGIIELETDKVTMESRMVLATTPSAMMYLSNKNIYGLSVVDMLKSTFPNMRLESAVQYGVAGGNLVQLIVEEVEGQEVGYCAFTEKLRAHAMVVEMSAFKQKKSQGTWGAIIFLPFAIAAMLGV